MHFETHILTFDDKKTCKKIMKKKRSRYPYGAPVERIDFFRLTGRWCELIFINDVARSRSKEISCSVTALHQRCTCRSGTLEDSAFLSCNYSLILDPIGCTSNKIVLLSCILYIQSNKIKWICFISFLFFCTSIIHLLSGAMLFG